MYVRCKLLFISLFYIAFVFTSCTGSDSATSGSSRFNFDSENADGDRPSDDEVDLGYIIKPGLIKTTRHSHNRVTFSTPPRNI